MLSGDNVTLSGDNITLSGDNVTLSGDNITLSGDRITLSGVHIALSCDHITLSYFPIIPSPDGFFFRQVLMIEVTLPEIGRGRVLVRMYSQFGVGRSTEVFSKFAAL